LADLERRIEETEREETVRLRWTARPETEQEAAT
jgi:hypothetical protein